MLTGWRRYRNHPDERIRRRSAFESRPLPITYAAIVGACCRHYRKEPAMRDRMRALRDDLVATFGWRTRVAASLGGRFLSFLLRREARRLAGGWSYEPPTFYERNAAAMALDPTGATRCRQVEAEHARPAASPVLTPAGSR